VSELTKRQTLEQGRAHYAWGKIEAVNQLNDDLKKKYSSITKKAPILVLTNGLGLTLAYLLGKDEAHNLLYEHIQSWILPKQPTIQSNKRLIKYIAKCSSTEYRQLTVETLAILNWIKRFAESVLPTEEE